MRILVCCFLLITNYVCCQTNINESVLLKPNEKKLFLIAANNGDLIDIEVEKERGKKISSFSLIALKSKKAVFIERNFKKFKSGITSSEKSVYQLDFVNNTSKEILFHVDVAVNSYGNPSAKLAYKTVYDTTYGPGETVMQDIEKLSTKTIQKERFYLNSKSNALVKGGKDRVIFPVYLPENTSEWFYVLTANRDEEAIKNTAQTFSLASELSKYLDTEVTSLSTAVTNLNAPPGAHICDVYLMDKNQAELFRKKEPFDFILEGSRENYKSGIIHVKEKSEKKYFIGIKNPDNIYGIHVGIEVVAIIKETKNMPKLIRTPIISTRQVPFVE